MQFRILRSVLPQTARLYDRGRYPLFLAFPSGKDTGLQQEAEFHTPISI